MLSIDKLGNLINIAVVYPVFYADSNRKLAQVLISIMGHSDTPSSRSFAFSNYDSDVEITDIESIKQAQQVSS
jgi:hypothetical protein